LTLVVKGNAKNLNETFENPRGHEGRCTSTCLEVKSCFRGGEKPERNNLAARKKQKRKGSLGTSRCGS